MQGANHSDTQGIARICNAAARPLNPAKNCDLKGEGYMLDTNTVSHLIKAHPVVAQRMVNVPMASLCISAITQGELLFGLAKWPNAMELHMAVQEFLQGVDALSWDRAAMERQGKILAPLDLLIAAHALSVDAVLVTNDWAFDQLADLAIEDWTKPK